MKSLKKLSLALAITLCSVNSYGYHYVGLNLTSTAPKILKTNQRVHYPHWVIGIVPNDLLSFEMGINHTNYNKDDLNLKFRTVHLTAFASVPLDGDNLKLVYGIGLTKVIKHQVKHYGACLRETKDSYQHQYKAIDADGCTRQDNYKMESSVKQVVPLKLEKDKSFPHFSVGIEKLLIPNLYLRALFSWQNYKSIGTNHPVLNNLHQFTIGVKYTYK